MRAVLSLIIWLVFVLQIGLFAGFYACKPRLNQASQLHWLPERTWRVQDTLQLAFQILDTTQTYGIFLLTHYISEYPYKNLWLNARISDQNQESNDFRINLELADNSRGYLGSGMANVYRNYSLWKTFQPQNPGIYKFSLSHLMQQDSLRGIYAVGMQILPLRN